MAEVDTRKDLLTRTSAKFHKGINKIIAEKLPGLPKKMNRATTKTLNEYYKIIDRIVKGAKKYQKRPATKKTILPIVSRFIQRHGFDALFPPKYSFGLDKDFKLWKTTPADKERLQAQMDEQYKQEMKKLKEKYLSGFKPQFKHEKGIKLPGDIKALEKIKDEANRLREINSNNDR